MLSNLATLIKKFRLPSICTLCNQLHDDSLAVCSFCTELINPLGPCCEQCAYPLPDTNYPLCGQCIQKPPYFDAAFIGYTFDEPLRSLLHQFKYHHGIYLNSFLSSLMLQSLKIIPKASQCLIPVPMHAKKLKQRGFNQAALLAKNLAHCLKIPYNLTSCQKIINTQPQAGLNGEQRQKNLKGAFDSKPIPFEHVILVDDLLTTGSTANEIALSLKNSGVQRVDIWCCARAIPKV